jgi:IPT/TIG domain/PASTA domain
VPAVGACIAFSTWPIGANAAPVTLGSPTAPASTPSARVRYIGNASTIANVELGEPGANVISPITGTIIRWRMAGNFLGGPFELRVLKPTSGGNYTYGAISEAASPTGIPQTIGTDLPIEAGDVIALEVPNESWVGFIELPGSETDRAVAHPPVAEGQIWEPKSQGAGREFAFNADVLAPPSVIAISPTTGTTASGSSVTISGSNFSEVQKVDFGGMAATSYTINSEGSITATSPPASAPGTVDVTVTTAAGTSPTGSSDSFTYTAPPVPPPPPLPQCIVPNLRGKSLGVAKKEIRTADCKVGWVTRGHGSRAKVVGQKPKPGTVSAADTKVNVKLGKVRRGRNKGGRRRLARFDHRNGRTAQRPRRYAKRTTQRRSKAIPSRWNNQRARAYDDRANAPAPSAISRTPPG